MPAAAPSAATSMETAPTAAPTCTKRASIKKEPRRRSTDGGSSAKVSPYHGDEAHLEHLSLQPLWAEVRQIRADMGEMRQEVSAVLPAVQALAAQLAALRSEVQQAASVPPADDVRAVSTDEV
mmetsp:Transcript_29456/g.78220  ORF Transcript_29456/g.78220 Transcript_29456/m.78220 type:complete len:123 (-) Transcript_29456:374-742(-)